MICVWDYIFPVSSTRNSPLPFEPSKAEFSYNKISPVAIHLLLLATYILWHRLPRNSLHCLCKHTYILWIGRELFWIKDIVSFLHFLRAWLRDMCWAYSFGKLEIVTNPGIFHIRKYQVKQTWILNTLKHGVGFARWQSTRKMLIFHRDWIRYYNWVLDIYSI